MPLPFLYASDDPPTPTPDPYTPLVELLSEAQHVVVEGSRSFEIQRVIERAQREVRRLRGRGRSVNAARIRLGGDEGDDDEQDNEEEQWQNSNNGDDSDSSYVPATITGGWSHGSGSTNRTRSASSSSSRLRSVSIVHGDDDTIGLLTESEEALGNLGSEEEEEDEVVRMIADLDQITIVPEDQYPRSGAEIRVEEVRSSEGGASLMVSVSGEQHLDLITALGRFIENQINRSAMSGLRIELVEEESDGAAGEEVAGGGLNSNEPLSRGEGRTTGHQELNMARADTSDGNANVPPVAEQSDPSGQTLRYTDLSQIQQQVSSTPSADMPLDLGSTPRVLDPENILGMTHRDADTLVMLPGGGSVRLGEMSENEAESSSSNTHTPLIIRNSGGITPRRSPPRSRQASLQREDASMSSTGATAGGSMPPATEKETPKEQAGPSPFTKERRAKLMTEMNADIARYSQRRAWALYQERGDCMFPSARPLAPERKKRTRRNRRRSTERRARPGNQAPEENRSRSLPRGGSPWRTQSPPPTATRRSSRLRRARQLDNRATSPVQQSERRPVYELRDPAEDFLNHLQSRARTPEAGIERIEGGIVSLTLVQEPMVGPSEQYRREFGEQVQRLRRNLGERGPGIIAENQREYCTHALVMMQGALRDGIDVREALRFLQEWFEWQATSQEVYPDVEDFLPMASLQLWVALRRGWGEWRPSQGFLDLLRLEFEICTDGAPFHHTPNALLFENRSQRVHEQIQGGGGILNPVFPFSTEYWTPEELETIVRPFSGEGETRSRAYVHQMIQWEAESEEYEEERGRLELLLQEEMFPAIRVWHIMENWIRAARRRYNMSETWRLNSESHFSLQELRLDRLERLIREENVINAHQLVRGPDGEWTEYQISRR